MNRDNLTKPNIPGWGIDLGYEHRPGVPMEIKDGRLPFNSPMVRSRTGASTAPWHALSGKLRKTAYSMPEHFATRPMMLIMADRVDVIEHQLKRNWPLLAGLGAAGLAGLLLAKRRKNRKGGGKKLRAKGNALEFSGAPITGGDTASGGETSDFRLQASDQEKPITCR